MDDPLVLTRYLYSKIEVKQSLLISLLEHKYDESLFWSYELYYSGFEDEVFNFLIDIFDTIYAHNNPKLHLFINKQKDAWINSPSDDWLLGSIVATLCHRNYSLSNFMQLYFGVKTTTLTNAPSNSPNFCINLNAAEIEKYQTVSVSNPHQYLKTACKYTAHKEINQLFNVDFSNIREQCWYSWQYYASRSPYWAAIIDEYGGVANDETKTIDFADDEDFDAFNNAWNVDFDEQSRETQEKIIGNSSTKQLSIKEFCSKYGEQLKTKMKITKTPIHLLTNSIMYTSNM